MNRIRVIFFVVLFVLFATADFWLLGEPEHGYFPWSNIPGIFAIFGFVFCVAIVVISKLLGHYWLQRKEDYYDKNGRGDRDE